MAIRTLILALFVLTGSAFADEANPAAEYKNCMDLAKTSPKLGFETAIAWRDMGGGAPAKHCVAASLMSLEDYDEAAKRFEEAAQDTNKDKPLIKAALLGQASQAWLMAGNPQRAEGTATAALKFNPLSHDLLLDRATARAALGDYKKAIKDLDKAIETNPQSTDAYVFRASAYRFLNNLDAAELDAEQALSLYPLHPEGLLERGIIRRLKGDDDGARTDWMKILKDFPNNPTAKPAQINLEMMDVKNDKQK